MQKEFSFSSVLNLYENWVFLFDTYLQSSIYKIYHSQE